MIDMAGCYCEDVAASGGGAGLGLAPTPTSTVPFGPERPFPATVRVNRVLTGIGASKEKRHLELDLGGSGMSYEPGDALAVLPRNSPRLVADLLEALGLPESAPAKVGQATKSLGEALAADYEITIPKPRFLHHWAMVSQSTELATLTDRDNTRARRDFLHDNHVIDIVRRFPVRGLDSQTVIAGLYPLEARHYSIASSPACGGYAAITVANACYELNGSLRRGVFSGHQAPFLTQGSDLPVFIEVNADFHLPADDRPLIMVGAGTGIAPFRAFVAERRARGARGPSWLFFGDRNAATDFLYRAEWERALRDGYLTRLDTAFSRDGPDRVHVQHRLIERAVELNSWLSDGAAIYVCGNASAMAPAVHATLIEIIMEQEHVAREAAFTRLGSLSREGRYRRYVY